MAKERFTSPVGRLLQGSVDEQQTKDQQGRERVVKTGPNAGQPSPQTYLGVAFRKDDPAWNDFHWLLIRKAAADFPSLFPNAAANDFTCIRPDFAWKIIDGDSPMHNQAGKAWNSYEGFPGHWVVRFTSGYLPRCFHAGRYAPQDQIQEKGVIRRGYFVRVSGTVEGNGDLQKPGLYLNPDMVELSAYGQEIVSGPDAGEAFGSAPAALPPGATAAPMTPPTPGAGPGAPPPPATAAAPPPPPVAAPAGPQRPTDPSHIHAAGTPQEQWYINGAWQPAAAPAAPALPAAASPAPASPPAPYSGYMDAAAGNGAPTAAPPSLPPSPPSAPAATPSPSSEPVMLPAAQGATYAQMIAAGWTDATMRERGMMA